MTSAAAIPTVTLNDENTMPVIGLGVGELSESETEQAVSAALEAGYRLIDTAAAYGNEAAVGRAIAASGVAREELFVTTKLATPDLGFQSGQDALKASIERLGLDYVDLYLIHWPAGEQGKYVDSWGGMMKRKQDGDTRSIGVANFHAEHLSNIIDLSFVTRHDDGSLALGPLGTFAAEDAVALLGLVAMRELRGASWKASDEQIDEFMARYKG